MKYLIALLIAFALFLPSGLAQDDVPEDAGATPLMMEGNAEMMDDNTVMPGRGMMMNEMMNDGMMTHKSKMYSKHYGAFGWEHAGWMLFHLVAWIVFLALSTYVVRWSWDRAGRKK